MSSYNKKIIKNVEAVQQQPVHLNDRAVGTRDDYIESTVQLTIDKMVNDMKKEIEKEKNKILSNIAQEKEQAIQRGYQEGYDQAKEVVKEELRLEMEEEFQKIRDVYEEANEHKKAVFEEVERSKEDWYNNQKSQLVDIIYQSVEQLIQSKLSKEDYDIEMMLEEAFLKVRDENETIWVRLHPKTYEMVQEKKMTERHVEWICDPILGPADIEIETKNEYIDGKIETKIADLKLMIRGVIEND